MKIFVDPRITKFLDKLNPTEKARLLRYKSLLEEHGLSLPEPYLKKLEKDIWELRPGSVRILFTIKGKTVIFAHAFYKKKQKTPLKDLKLVRKRILEY